ncbi:MAG: DUF4438 domain-containing protein [Clostridia bacterium]|nr:DUF4438 domain-containing protein [Clostridia bacterium]
MIRTNKDKCVMQSVIGAVHSPTARYGARMSVDVEGRPFTLPSVGGICYNVKIGDCVYGLAGDHIEPGVSVQNTDLLENGALNMLSCVGNRAKVVTGDAKGALGYVTGMHGGIEHCLMWFDDDTIEKLCIGDKIQVKSYGQGLKLLDYPNIRVMNCDPDLLEKLNISEQANKLYVPVAGIVPAYLMGSGTGSQAQTGDYDIMTADKKTLDKYDLNNLRFGDIVFLQDCDNMYGRGYLKGARTIGVVVHSDCIIGGHGPGVTTLITCKLPRIVPVIDKSANIKKYLQL